MPRTRKKNLLFIFSDEHNRNVSGCYGHPLVQTPHLDALAARGTRFTSAYCNSPVCVPSRAALATGRYPHQVGSWDNATPYCGASESWHSILRANGVDVTSIGKLHFRGGDDNGFTEEILPLHVVDGVGDLKGLFRSDNPPNESLANLAKKAGRGVSSYCDYDCRIAVAARNWLADRTQSDRPFVLFVSFVMPHFPLVAPAEFYDLYEKYDLETLSRGLHAPTPSHPVVERMKQYFNYDSHFDDTTRANALRAYFGMVSCLDDLIGGVIGALDETGLSEDTRILYSSDHGDNLGNRGFWGKALMYEDSVAVPMILAGDGVPQNAVVDTPVSLVDVAPTALDCTGTGTGGGAEFVGESLIGLANAPAERTVMAEYHAGGTAAGNFMVRRGRWKYIHYIDGPPQLFDLAADPGELDDLGDSPAHADVRAELYAELTAICDPLETSNRALADQAMLIKRHGGAEKIMQRPNIPFTPPPT